MLKKLFLLAVTIISFSVFAAEPTLICENEEGFYRESSFYNGESGLAFWSSQNVNVIIFAKAQPNNFSLKINVLNFTNGERIELLRNLALGGSVKIPTEEKISCSIRD